MTNSEPMEVTFPWQERSDTLPFIDRIPPPSLATAASLPSLSLPVMGFAGCSREGRAGCLGPARRRWPRGPCQSSSGQSMERVPRVTGSSHRKTVGLGHASKMSYDLKRLRLNGLISKEKGTTRYTVTPYGMRALFLTKVHNRVLRRGMETVNEPGISPPSGLGSPGN